METSTTKIPAVAFIGRSGSGKTTVIEKVIRLLDEHGYKVGAIKHHGHRGFDIDVEGKDSWRMTQAGSRHTAIISPDRMAAYCELNEIEKMDLEDIVNKMTDVDVVIVEGFKKSHIPCIELFRAGNPEDEHALDVMGGFRSCAVVTDMEDVRSRALAENLPCFGFDDASAIVEFIVEHVIKGFVAAKPSEG